jgi:Mn2+/Fe2+ NRAMP family transporter
MKSGEIYDPYALPADAIQPPPTNLWRALRNIGPGIILAGSIVGSGELILTTKFGAQYGYAFLWLILFSCVIKVFVQIELGRYAISSGKPTLGAINELRGPRLGAHILVWWWLIMMLTTFTQIGGMAGGVGQAMDLAFPHAARTIADWTQPFWPDLASLIRQRPDYPWAILASLTAVILLVSGGYRRVEQLSVYLVAAVTLLTVLSVAVLPMTPYAIRWDRVVEGFQFLVPAAGMAVAFGVFGVTGVGATELYAYPYWCLEKGYARFAGSRDGSEEWLQRARGWIRVMQLDAWCSMIVFTLATVSFYFMGAAVLHPQHLIPEDKAMVDTLSQMYAKPFGLWTQMVFLIGCGAVLFKTLYISCAGHARLTADFFSLAKFLQFETSRDRARWIQVLCVFYPLLALALLLTLKNPVKMVVIGAVAQAATLPIISGITVFFRYFGTDPRLAPRRFSDACLWLAFFSISCVAAYAVYSQLSSLWPAAAR